MASVGQMLANPADARAFRRWKHSLSHYNCKECNGTNRDGFETITKPSLMHHITRIHDISEAEYTERHGPIPSADCKACPRRSGSSQARHPTLRALQIHLEAAHRMSLEDYFIAKIKPLQANAEDEGEGVQPEQVVTHPDLAFLDSLEAWSDFVVVLETGTRLKCHKVTLAKWSPVLEAMLRSDCRETQRGEIEIRGHDDITVKTLIKYLYQGTLDPKRYTLELLRIADQYQVKRVFSETFKTANSPALGRLVKALTADNVIELWQLAETHEVDTLKKAALQFMVKKGKDMMSLRGIESLGANQMRTLLAFTLENPSLVPKKRLTRVQLRQQLIELERDIANEPNEPMNPMLQINDLHLPDGVLAYDLMHM